MRSVRFALYGLVAFSVLAHGGVEEWARAVFETGAGLLFLCWTILFYTEKRSSVFVTPLLPPLIALLSVSFAQWVFHLSLLPFATRREFQLLLADVLLLYVAAQTIRKLEEWKEFIWF